MSDKDFAMRQFAVILRTTSLPRVCLGSSLDWFLQRLGIIIKKLVERYLECACVFFQSFDAGNCVTVLHTGGVAAEQSGTLLNVALAEVLCFAQFSQSVADNHCRDITTSFRLRKGIVPLPDTRTNAQHRRENHLHPLKHLSRRGLLFYRRVQRPRLGTV